MLINKRNIVGNYEEKKVKAARGEDACYKINDTYDQMPERFEVLNTFCLFIRREVLFSGEAREEERKGKDSSVRRIFLLCPFFHCGK